MPVDPEEVEVIREAIRSALIDVHVALPARVDAYDAAKQTVKVTLCVTRDRFVVDDRSTKTEQMPQLENVPVAWPRGGGFFSTLPLKKGDFVELIFNEAATGVFRESGEVPSRPGDLRRHHIAHPVAVPGGGAYPDAQPIADARDDAAVLGALDGDNAQVAITDGGEIHLGKNAVEGVARADRVEAELNSIRSAVQNHTHGVGSYSADPNSGTITGSSGSAPSIPAVGDTSCDIVKGL